ncbi:murein L,D-transpeptidase [Streptomyces luteolifulvus]|jgi:peptidoglycan hydrolase-like protein with peptidoglycan-binding domain|uniref:Murein L,D-transpeptidase n=1 Tax=Streptomyces luteolifulvus TaxID=2615112 RepID=A0A6H9V222_9ACTN|nr:L,D-transpeptidase family protein [Streptomyces luteolifulvus]KAB1146101.1 murein L,D-transpeptidase [Streptomyces luteolifulvus]
MRKTAAVLVALVAVSACTVRTADGERQSPVHIDVPGRPATTSPADDRPSPARTTRAAVPAVLWSRGDTGRDVRELQARLRQVAWLFDGPTGTYDDLTERAVRGFQGKRGLPQTGRTDTVTWRRLLRMTHEPGKWDLYLMGGQPAGAPDPRCLTGRVLCIDKSSRTLRWMIGGRTVSTMSVRFGSQYTPTREGVFQVYWKSRHHVSTLYDSPMPYAMFFSGGQAVHYSYDFAARGYAGASHGCVNVRDEAAIAALYAQVRNGDKVVVYG